MHNLGLIGILGIIAVIQKKCIGTNTSAYNAFIIFFIGIILTGTSSIYYHINPDNDSLLWDRLAMSITFMSFFSIIIWENLDRRLGKILYIPLLMTDLS